MKISKKPQQQLRFSAGYIKLWKRLMNEPGRRESANNVREVFKEGILGLQKKYERKESK